MGEYSDAVRSGVSAVAEVFRRFETPGHWLLFLAAALLLVLLFGKRTGRTAFIWPSVFVFACLLNPLVFPQLSRLVPSFRTETFRLLWLLPMTLIMVFGFASLLARLSGRPAVRMICVFITAAGFLAVTAPVIAQIPSLISVPADIGMADGELMAVCGYFRDEAGADEPTVAFEEKNMSERVREYDPAIRISSVFTETEDAGEELTADALRKQKPDYVVLAKGSPSADVLKELGYRAAAYTDEHLIYVHKAE